MDKEKLLRYAALKSQIKILTAEMEEMKPVILEAMEEEGAEEVILPNVGKLFLKERRTWTYSKELTEAEAKLKADKKVEQQKKIATCDITRELNFKGINESGTEEV